MKQIGYIHALFERVFKPSQASRFHRVFTSIDRLYRAKKQPESITLAEILKMEIHAGIPADDICRGIIAQIRNKGA